jgi:hypothetical protein
MIYKDLQALFFLILGYVSDRYKKIALSFCLFIYGLNNGYGQCLPTFTDFGPYNPVCSFQWLSYPGGGQIRINLSPLTIANTYRFTTVGETVEDTYLAFYDSSGTVLASNDDDADCLGCKQSTILFDSQALYSGAYLILSKSGCQDLSVANMRFNVTNNYDAPPDIVEPEIPFYPCKGRTVDLDTSAISLPVNPWSSTDSSVAVINSATGIVTFLKAGIVQIKLIGNLNCETIKTYHVVATETSAITHD